MEYGTAQYWEAMFKALWNSLSDEQKFSAKATEAMGKVIDMGKKKHGRS